MRSDTKASTKSLYSYAQLLSESACLRWLTLCVWCFLLSSSNVISNGTVSGIVEDSVTHESVRGATLRLSNTTLGRIAKKDGRFTFSNVPNGKYVLTATMLGYTTGSFTVLIRDNDSVFLTLRLHPQSIQTSEVVVSANKRLQAVQDVPLSIAVVEANDISDRGVTKLDEILRYVPGVRVAQNQVDIRGASGFAYGLGSRTTLMLDNFPMLSADNGDISFDAMPMFSVDRIEVVKGPGSALYGSSAIGGVVNVITSEPPSEAQTRIRVLQGIYTRPKYDTWIWTDRILQRQSADASYARTFGRTGLVIAGGLRSDDTHLQSNDSRRANLYAKGTHTLSPFSQLMVFGQYSYEDRADWVNWQSLERATQPPLSSLPDVRIYSSKLAVGSELKNVLSENTFAVLRASLFRTWYANTAPQTSDSYLASTATVYNSEGQFTTSINKKISMTVGLSLTANDVRSSQTSGTKIQMIAAGYGQVELSNLDDIIVTMGGRMDLEKTRGENKNLEISPKLGISYKSPWGTNIRLSAGRSFRAPSVIERYANIRFAGFTVGRNPNLKPETGWAFELGGEQTFEVFSLPLDIDVALFQSNLFELIEPQFVITPQKSEIQFVNITRARIQGAELDCKTWLVPKVLGLQSSITLMSPMDLTTEKTLTFRHNYMWTSRMMYVWRALELQCDYRYLSRQEEVDERLVNLGLVVNGDVRVPVHVVDARLIYNNNSFDSLPLRFTFSVRNLLDYYYVEVPGNLAATRSVSVQLDLNF